MPSAIASVASKMASNFDLYDPSEETVLLRQTVRRFVEREVEPQDLEYVR